MTPLGVGIRWNGCYWASLTLHPGSTGRTDAFFGPVGPGPHHHSWLKWTDGDLTELGGRLKDAALGNRPPAHSSTALSTQTMARFRATWDPDRQCVTTEIADVFSGSAYTAAPSESSRLTSKTGIPMIDVAVPADARTIEGELAYCHVPLGVAPQSLSTQAAFLPVSSDSTIGIAMLITRWSTG